MSRKIEDGKTPQQRYADKRIVQVGLDLNKTRDADIIAWLDTQDKPRQTAVKEAVRGYIRVGKNRKQN